MDTSAFVKLFVREAETEQVVALVEGNQIAASALIRVEVRATLARKQFKRELDDAEVGALMEAVETVLSTSWVIDLSAETLDLAGRLVLKPQGLRSLDALHLASALVLRRRVGNATLVTYDQRLRGAAALEGLEVSP